jgi:hypothetical protein
MFFQSSQVVSLSTNSLYLTKSNFTTFSLYHLLAHVRALPTCALIIYKSSKPLLDALSSPFVCDQVFVLLLNSFTIIGLAKQSVPAWMVDIGDAVRASQADNQRLLARSYQTWSSYSKEANLQNRLQSCCIQLRNILGRVSAFLANGFTKHSGSPQLRLEQKRIGQ